ncbi:MULTISPECIES: tetratricopeptide repeat protein [unclassified Pseudodesulfovibrio]|uniref:tetratricopeptide repeat protein n=1 Tax=unclassified Pseudodesulfovibrio TaxID=2661612 RepID=UPI0013E28BD6|nr:MULTISPECIES: tetratricopeptide repeat protein [unclassified Pseudodesulfovibrio]MCJ2163384.1 tetratricopeptide repeat protein [Pseudodesulfovibrio sp. S3-i]
MSIDDAHFADAVSVLREYMEQAEEAIPPQAYLMLGGAQYRKGDREQAFKVFLKGLDAYPDNVELARNSAVACYELGRYADAGRLFEKTYALKSPPESVLLFHAGSAYYSGGEYAAAAKVMARLLAVDKNPKKEWVRLAVHAHLEAKQFKRAESMLHTYLASNPDDAPYWQLLSKLHLDREEYAKAASALEICYRLGSPSSKELERLASLYVYVNAPLMASDALKRAYPGASDEEHAIRIAQLTASSGRTDEAVRQLSRFAPSVSLAEEKGEILYRARRFKEAEQVFLDILKKNANALESRYFLAMCAWENRDWKTARVHLDALSGNREFVGRVKAPISVIDDIELARKEALE